MQDRILLEVKGLVKYFPVASGIIFRRKVAHIKAVDGVSFHVKRGETLGLVGESGCGKTTIGMCILQLYRPTSGEVLFEGTDMCKLNSKSLHYMRRKLQPILQDPYGSLDPRMTAGNIIGEPLRVHRMAQGAEYKEQVDELLRIVGLNPYMRYRYPHEFSGGQRQRIAIARALSVKPSLIICDEPISALDVSIQAQIVDLLEELQERFNLAYLFIAHDLSMVRHISDRVAVMYLGKIVEIASAEEFYDRPLHPYTKSLLSAVPIPDPAVEAKRERITLTGEVPSPLRPPPGCNFNPRCSNVMPRCRQEIPKLRNVGSNHWVACHLVYA